MEGSRSGVTIEIIVLIPICNIESRFKSSRFRRVGGVRCCQTLGCT